MKEAYAQVLHHRTNRKSLRAIFASRPPDLEGDRIEVYIGDQLLRATEIVSFFKGLAYLTGIQITRPEFKERFLRGVINANSFAYRRALSVRPLPLSTAPKTS